MNLLRRTLKGQRGFTLVEMIVVIAIMGVMTAVAVPVVTNNLSKSKSQAYAQDLALIQTAVDSYFTAADNLRHLGLRQYPINAVGDLGSTRLWTDADQVAQQEDLANPQLGTRGGEPFWRDGGDQGANGERDNRTAGGATEVISPVLDVVFDTISPTIDSWYLAKIDLQGVEYAIDPRGYFIDFSKLVAAGLLKAAPNSASTDNGGVTNGGSYSWFVKATGSVDSILAVYPYNGLALNDGIVGSALTNGLSGDDLITASDLRGFQEGIYP